MPITVFKEFRTGAWPSYSRSRRVPYEIYTLAEAAERGITPVENWREAIFKRHEDLTGKYILTDDDPPLVTPIVAIRTDYLSKQVKKVQFPWTWIPSSKREVRYGKKGFVHSRVREVFQRTKPAAIKNFILLFALGAEPREIVKCIWSLQHELEQDRFLRMVMTSDKTAEAMSELASDVFKGVDFGPEKVAEAMKKLALDKDTKASVRARMLETIADRIGLDDREEKPQTTIYTGMGTIGAGDGSVPSQVTAGLAKALAQQAGDNTKVKALIEVQGKVVPDE